MQLPRFAHCTIPDKLFAHGTIPDKSFAHGTIADKSFAHGTIAAKLFAHAMSTFCTRLNIFEVVHQRFLFIQTRLNLKCTLVLHGI